MRGKKEIMEQNVLTISELAERWNISVSTIYRNRKYGLLPSVMILGRVRFKLDDIEKIEKGEKCISTKDTTKTGVLSIKALKSQLIQMMRMRRNAS